MTKKYQRVLVKVSGEVLMGEREFGIDMPTISRIAGELADISNSGCELCLVIGGGNIFRGVSGAASGMDRANGDYMGMLATVMNALAMQNSLDQRGVDARVMSAIPMPTVCEPFVRARAVKHLARGRVVIFAAGTGNPFFTTDTAAALRAAEMKCDALLKGTSVDGVYSADPKRDANATRYDQVSYQEVLSNNLKVMDAAAITLARDNAIPVIVFSIREEGTLAAVIRGEGTSTTVS